MPIAHLTERIHAIRTQTKPYVSRIQGKVSVRSIYFSLLWPISWVSQHWVLLAFLFVPSHQLSIIFISKQMLQIWYYRGVPHDLGGNSLPGTLPLDVPRIIFFGSCNAMHRIRGKYPNSRSHLGRGCSHWDMHVSSAPPILEGKQVVSLRTSC